MTPFVHKISHYLAHIIISCSLELPSQEIYVQQRHLFLNSRGLLIALRLFNLLVEATVQNKQQIGWFLKPKSQVRSILHFLGFPNIPQNHYFICLN